MNKYYSVGIKNLDDDWETRGENCKTLKQAIRLAKTIDKNTYKALDISLVIDNDLITTFDISGKER